MSCFLRIVAKECVSRGLGEARYRTLCTCVVISLQPLAGTKYSGISFRRALLDTISHIGMFKHQRGLHLGNEPDFFSLFSPDELAHVIIPLHPKLKPHARMLHHFRFLNPLLPKDEDGISPLHYYDSAIQLARNSACALTEEEFEIGLNAAYQIEKMSVCFLCNTRELTLKYRSSLNDCRLEMLESDSTTQFEDPLPK